ncbi:MAG TPA: pyruvate phosphate dikinase, partial [Eubacteriaceae bacterium]|nr:pyruvate phosphate dikinase [Eubacteriaceae bacterium]
MPGAMKTFLNVGMNDAIAEAYSKKEGCGWTAWDCYRRFLQSWGMAYGMKRDDFDQIMKEHKEKRGVAFKIQFTDDQMKQLALSYKEALTKRGIHVKDEPFEQLKLAIHSVMDSWFSESAINYRNHSQVAEEWGTAVVVQEMVLGNQSDNSGSGVIFTSSPFNGTTGMNLYGDFALCSQGEDIVSGLVNTLPITEDQRKRHYKDSSMSLESAFPKIYQALMRYAKRLLEEYGFVHQEIEFTFESEQPDDLYILQTRNQNLKKSTSFESFAPPLKQMQRVGYGIGVSSGVLSGILAFDLDDIHTLKEEQPDQKIILVRPDTVPDDIPQIFACDGLITAKGGVTSHAAVTA